MPTTFFITPPRNDKKRSGKKRIYLLAVTNNHIAGRLQLRSSTTPQQIVDFVNQKMLSQEERVFRVLGTNNRLCAAQIRAEDPKINYSTLTKLHRNGKIHRISWTGPYYNGRIRKVYLYYVL